MKSHMSSVSPLFAKIKQSSQTEISSNLEIFTCDPLNYKMDTVADPEAVWHFIRVSTVC